MPLALSVADNEDGTASVTVAGSPGPGTVLAAPFTGREGGLVWAPVWAFAADGSAAVTTAPGHYVWLAAAGADLSGPVYQSVADPAPALAEQCLRAVAARVQLLGLSRIGDRVYVRAEAKDLNVSYPCAFVCPPAAAEAGGADAGTNLRSDWGHPVRVTVADRKHPDRGDQTLPDFARWRQQVFRAFDRERLPGVPAVLQTLVEPGPVMQFHVTREGEYSLAATELTVRCVARQPRGFGT